MNKDDIAGLRGLSDDALQKVSNAFDYGETLNVASMRQIVEILADELEMIISQPDCDGDFEGDVWFGHPEKRTLGTHIWRAGLWHELPTELDAVISLLGQARSQRDANTDALTTLSAENERLREAAWKVLAYDQLLRKVGEIRAEALLAGDMPNVDAAYDDMVKTCVNALSGKNGDCIMRAPNPVGFIWDNEQWH